MRLLQGRRTGPLKARQAGAAPSCRCLDSACPPTPMPFPPRTQDDHGWWRAMLQAAEKHDEHKFIFATAAADGLVRSERACEYQGCFVGEEMEWMRITCHQRQPPD